MAYCAADKVTWRLPRDDVEVPPEAHRANAEFLVHGFKAVDGVWSKRLAIIIRKDWIKEMVLAQIETQRRLLEKNWHRLPRD